MSAVVSTLHAESPSRRSTWTRFALFAAGVVLLGFFVARIGVSEIRARLESAGPRVWWMLLPYAVGTTIGAFPLAWLLPSSDRPTRLQLVLGRFAASSANALLPVFGLAGEPSRLLWLAPGARSVGLAAILVERLLYNASNALLLVAGAAVAAGATPLPRAVGTVALIVALFMLAATFVGLWLLGHSGIARRAHRVLRRMLPKELRAPALGEQVDTALIGLVRGPRGRLAAGVVCHLFARATISAEVYLGLWALAGSPRLIEAVVLAVVPIALSVFFSSVPSQLGVQEAAMLAVGTAIGMSAPLVVALVLLQRFRQLLYAIPLPWLLAFARARSAATRVPATEDASTAGEGHEPGKSCAPSAPGSGTAGPVGEA